MVTNSGVYIHIPFCAKKCNYCNFYSLSGKESLMDAYADALVGEINNFPEKRTIDTIFMGGGTPSLLPLPLLERIMSALYRRFSLHKNCETTIEVNPKTLDDFRSLKNIGFNRVSLGAQSAINSELSLLGRIHTHEDFLRAYHLARAHFTNINVDLMFGIPDQTLASWEQTLSGILRLAPEHISCYSLSIEKNTPFENARLNLPDEDTERAMYARISDFLPGYHHYEISNWAIAGYECRHNLKYWNLADYIGFGAGAHGYASSVRTANTADIEGYISGEQPKRAINSASDDIAEFMFLGLRQIDGISIKRFKSIFKTDIFSLYGAIIEKYLRLKIMELNGGKLRLSTRGIEVSNRVLCDFLP
ncbi:MAG: radical SAM family heme chaperone HemW [Clostridiales bacterium]|jgi:oxygen-independent coproporphyrinogen-3 oxidase|nr:radical SAM family heme chaperone HemW [Clostridiales bacterium]